jgi:hypothetical protein
MKQGTHDNPPQFTFGQMINNPLQPVLNSIAMTMPTENGRAFPPADDGYAVNDRSPALISVLSGVPGATAGFGSAGIPVRGKGSSLMSLSQLGSEEPEKTE